MMKIVNILIIALGVLLLSSCSKEPIVGGNEPLPEGTVQIKFALSDNGAAQPNAQSRAGETDAGNPAESRIRNLKVLFYNIGATDETSTLKTSSMFDLTPQSPDSENDPIDKGHFNWDPVTKVLTFLFYATEKYKVVVIANWGDQNWFKKVQTIKALDECFTNIDAKNAYDLANGSTPLILMSGTTEHNFKINPIATVPLTRQLARIDLKVTVNADFLKAYPGVNFQNPDLRFYNMPNCSYIRDTNVSNPKFDKLLKQSGNYLFNFIELKYSYNMPPVFRTTAYVYENLTFGDKLDNAETRKNAFFMVMKIPYTLNGTTVTENYYKFYIEDRSFTDLANPHKIVRNHLYRVNVEVKGFGGATPNDDNLHITTEVLPWDEVLLDYETVGDFLLVNRTEINLGYAYGGSFPLWAGDNFVDLVVESNEMAILSIADTDGNADYLPLTSSGPSSMDCVGIAYDDTNKGVRITAMFAPVGMNDSKDISLGYKMIRIEHNKLRRFIPLNFYPHPGYLMAKGDLTFKDGKFYLLPESEATTPEAQTYYGAYFKFGSIIPIKNIDNGVVVSDRFDPTDVMWSPVPIETYADIQPETEVFVVHNLAKIRAGKGDPCRLVGLDLAAAVAGTGPIDNGIWRLPTERELKCLTESPTDWSEVVDALKNKYRKSERFSLYFPLAGGRLWDGIIWGNLVHSTGCWQSNQRTDASIGNFFTTLVTDRHDTSPLPIVKNSIPIQNSVTVRCIRRK